jgi:hypothetical protein
MHKKILLISFILLSLIRNSHAENSGKLEDVFEKWNVLTIQDSLDRKICYIASVPIDMSGNYKKRSDPYILVTIFPDKSEEVSLTSGYKYKNGSEVEVIIDRLKYDLKTRSELAWATTGNDDKSIIENMQKGTNLEVKGVSTLGTYSIDEYSLAGFVQAYQKMKILCDDE